MAEIARSRVGVTTYLVPDGALNEKSRLQALRHTIAECVAAREFHLVLDLSGAPVVSSEALELLLEAQERVARLGGSLAAVNANAAIRDVFRFTGVADHVALADLEEPPQRGEAAELGSRRIGQILLERGLVTPEVVAQALELHQESGERMAEIMVKRGWLAERDLLEALSEQLGVSFVWLRVGLFDPEVVRLIDIQVARRLRALPLFRVRGILYVATADPQSVPALDEIHELTGCRARPVLACSEDIRKITEEAFSQGDRLAEYVGDLEGDLQLVEARLAEDQAVIDQMAEGSPVVNLINGVIQRAIRDGASDIHVEPSRLRCRIRLRVDGILYTVMNPPMDVHPALVSRLKVMANLDIAERRLPQDGRIQVVTAGRSVDLRFSSLPSIYGEKVVLRVLDKNQSILDIEGLGLSPDNLGRFQKLLSRSYGLVLVTGPTGSGKTTTLYAAVHHLNSDERNITTIEDPVEYQIDSIVQNQVREKIGLSFAMMLKHVLRQDPDVIMVGEIRERETAQIAVQAALTGHLVLSTLHTNDSISAVTRMVDMGVEPYLLSSALLGVMAQRLVRGVCPDCRASYVAAAEKLRGYGVEADGKLRLARGRGCASCYDSGYKGRMAIQEIVECDADLQQLIVSSPTRSDLDAYLRRKQLKTLLDDGMRRALAGQTTVEEVLRVINS